LRSPVVRLVTLRFSAKLPVWASDVRVQVNVFVPEPPSSQQVGVLPEAVSRDGFWSRLALPTVAEAEAVVVSEAIGEA